MATTQVGLADNHVTMGVGTRCSVGGCTKRNAESAVSKGPIQECIRGMTLVLGQRENPVDRTSVPSTWLPAQSARKKLLVFSKCSESWSKVKSIGSSWLPCSNVRSIGSSRLPGPS